MYEFDKEIIKYKNSLPNLVQIIDCYGKEDIIEETTRIPRILGAKVIALDYIWPLIQHRKCNVKEHNIKRNLDNIESKCKELDITYIKVDKNIYSGEAYNLGLEYIRNNNIPCNYIWRLDSDVTIDPYDLNKVISAIGQYPNKHIITFPQSKELFHNWKFKVLNGGQHTINSIVYHKDLLNVQKTSGFDGHHHFDNIPIDDIDFRSDITALHLHELTKYSIHRVYNNSWNGGNINFDIDTDTKHIIMNDYFEFLKNKYNFRDNSNIDHSMNTHIGNLNEIKN